MAIFKVKAVPDFTQLRSELTKLSSTPVKIHVDATEFTALSNQAIKTMNATARLTRAQNELAVAQEKTKQTANQLAAAQQKTTQSANQLATQMEKTATAEEKARKANLDLSREIQKATTEQEKQKTVAAQTALQQEKTATSAANLAVQQEKTATAAAKAAGSISKVGESAKTASGSAGLLGNALKMAQWQLLGSAISAVSSAFKDALDTMKSVDDEMVVIRKVTGATTEELQKIEEQAYKTASAYGVAADEYLNSVAAFSRAGYGKQASALAELATKTQIVGDTDAQTAQQFLLSVDAAYQYKGSIEALSKVLDGANELDNKYATSIEKIAEGLGTVAPVAAQAHVGVDELTAAIGTITAVTQRSGSEAARAFRALVLNIVGDTKTEIDEGVTWTTGEIAGLRDVIKVYAKDAYDAAQATGDVINPMKAIAGLAQSMKDGLLTEQQLMEMVSDIGGKLRTSQLLALIQNWDMYESMLADYGNAVGSADKEVENALDSWSRKTEILKNKWTEFVGNLVETDGIKNLLDSVIDLVDGLNEGAEAFSLIGDIVSFVIGLFGTLASAIGESVGAISKWVKSSGGDYEAFTDDIAEATEQIEKNKARLDEINNTPWNERTTAILAEKEALEKENAELEANIQLMEKKNYQSADTQANAEVEVTRGTSIKSGLLGLEWSSTEEAVEAINKIYGEGTLASKIYIKNLTEVNDTIKASGDALNNYLANTIEKYSEMIREGNELTDQQIIEYEGAMEAAQKQAGAYRTLAANGDTLTESQLRVVNALDNTTAAEERLQAETQKTVSDFLTEAQQTELSVSQQIAALQALGLQAGYTAQDLARVYAYANGAGTYQADSAEIKKRAQELLNSGKVSSISQAFNQAKKELTQESWGNLTGGYTPSGGGYSGGGSISSSGSGSSGSSDSARKNAQAAIKQLQKERDAELDVIQKQIDALQDQAEIEDRQAKIEEYKLEILKKQDAVMNARNERTVRQYNASTGQWEWVADATKVKKAEEDLENAKKELREYERKVELDLAVEELKTRQEAIKAAYQIKIDAWQDYLDGLANAVATEAQYLAQSVANNKSAVDQILADKSRLNGDLDGDGEIESPSGKDDTVYSPSNASETDIKTMQAYLGVTPDGKWGTKSVTALKNSRFASFDEMLRYFYSDGGPLDKAVSAVSSGNSKATQQFNGMKTQGYSNQISYASVARVMGYDEGGILQGMGGIKATAQDEIVLPPKLAARMLTPLASQTFRARVSELGYMYGSEATVPKSLAGNTDNRSYTDHSGATYQIGSIALTERQARSTTIYEAAQLAHNLQAFSGE